MTPLDKNLFYSPWNFLGLEPERAAYATSRVAVLPVPYDATATARSGARDGPDAIIRASQEIELYDVEMAFDASRHGIHTLPPLTPHSGNPQAMAQRIETAVEGLLDDGKFVVTLGGEHTVSVGAVRAHARRHPGLSVLCIDAHADLRDQYLDSPYNHACTLRRVLETCPVVQVGLRSASEEEAALIRERDLAFLTPAAYRALADGPRAIAAMLSPDVYVSVDLDGLDPAQMAAVGTPEPGGLFWDELMGLLAAIAAEKRIVGFDITELAPELGPPACANLAAKLTQRLIGLALGPPKG